MKNFLIKNKKVSVVILIIAMLIIGNIVIFGSGAVNIILDANAIGDNTAELTWTNSDEVGLYNYRVLRSVEGGAYQGLSATGNEKIKVLNIHPSVGEMLTFTSALDGQSYTLPKAASLKIWMEQANVLDVNGYGRGIITVDSVSLTDFNSNPSMYLNKDANGDYNYDVIMFGTWDSNNSEDLSSSSLEVTRQYMEAGGGTIFGHDTINQPTRLFAALRPYVNLRVGEGNVQTSGGGTCEVEITKDGSFTTYPWNIGSSGTVLTVPQTHSWAMAADGNIWIRFAGYPATPENFYLTTYNSYAVIQTGHSSGAATDDEQKILANLIFYLADIKMEKRDLDTGFVDIHAPSKPVLDKNTLNGLNGTVTYSSEDVGTLYSYYVEATEELTQEKTNSSVKSLRALSNVLGYSYVIDTNATTEPDNSVDTTSSSISYTLGNGPKTYLHIKAIDNAGNVGETIHILLHDNIAPTLDLTPDITAWTNTNVVITATGLDVDGEVVTIKKPDATTASADTTTYEVSSNGTYEFVATDNSGATVTENITITNIDKVDPQGTYNIVQPTVSVRAAVIEFSATDDASGVKEIILPDGTTVESSQANYYVVEPGTYTFIVFDVAGNEKEVDVEVTIVSDGLDVRHIDQVTGVDLVPVDERTGNVGDSYTTAEETITGYELVLTPSNANGDLGIDKITVTYEYRKISYVVSRYFDINAGTRIIADVTDEYKEGDAYTTEEKTFAGYTLVETSSNASGTVERVNITVNYDYKKIAEGVEIRHIDQVTGELLDTDTTLIGLENDTYTTSDKAITGYELVLTPSNASGKMTVGKITVTYEYRKLSNVVTKYVDANTNSEITGDITNTYKEGDAYITEEKSFSGYSVIGNTGNVSGTVVRENIEVMYQYKKIAGGVEIKHIDQVTGELLDTDTTLTGLENDAYTTSDKAVSGYELVVMPSNASGTMTVEKITVTYEYRKLSDVIEKHIDANTGTEIIGDITTSYKEGDSYTVLPQDFAGYVVTKEADNKTGVVERDNITVVYEYKKVSDGLIVKYVDEITNEILEEKVYTGNENDVIELEELSFEGYITRSTPNKDKVILEVGVQEERYYYRKLITINIIGINSNTGEEIYKKAQEGIEGEEYTALPLELSGYVVVKTADNSTGTYARGDTAVTYEYKKIAGVVEVKYINNDTKEVIESYEIDGLEKDTYTSAKKTYEKYNYIGSTGNEIGEMTVAKIVVEYYYEKKISQVEVIYVDEEGNELKIEELEGKVDSEYKITPKDIENYRIKEMPDNVEGIYTLDKITVTYVMEKIPGKVIVNLKDKQGNIIGKMEANGYVGESIRIELPEKEGYYIVGGTIIEVDYEDGEIVIDVEYEKIEIPETSDISVGLYLTLFVVSGIIIYRITKKEMYYKK